MIEYVKEHRMGRDGVSTVVRPSQPHTPRSSGQTGPPAADPTQLTAWGAGGGRRFSLQNVAFTVSR